MATVKTLREQLDIVRAYWELIQPDSVRAFDAANAEIESRGLVSNAIGENTQAPDFTLPAASGRDVRLYEALQSGPVVLTFFRGGWCPYCDLQLRAYAQALDSSAFANAKLIAVSPQRPERSLETAARSNLQFDVLSDLGNCVARTYGLVFDVADHIATIYRSNNIDLPEWNGLDSWELPVPATYVIDTSGAIRLAFMDSDYTRRLDPREILNCLLLLTNDSPGN